MKTILYISLLIAVLSQGVVDSAAQGKTMVMTLSTEKQFTMYKKPLVVINTERGMITVKGWQSSEIKVVLKLTAKNADSDLARKELDYMKYSITKTYNTVYVSNKMLLPKPNQEISSVIVAEYEIFVPFNADIHVDNRFGKLSIIDVKGLLDGELNYSDLSLLRKSGNINFLITIGDFTCSKSKLNGKIVTKHSNISIFETIGRLTMETEYGNMKMSYGSELLRLTVVSNATDINIENKSCKPLILHLAGTYCPLKMDNKCYTPDKKLVKSDYNPNSEQEDWKLLYSPVEKNSGLTINAKFGSINLY